MDKDSLAHQILNFYDEISRINCSATNNDRIKVKLKGLSPVNYRLQSFN